MTQKKLNVILTVACAVFAALAIVLLVFGIIYDGEHLFTKIFMLVCAVLSAALALEIAYINWFSGSTEAPNYFLYDTSSKKNIPVDKLGAAAINSRMDKYLSSLAPSEGRIWTDGILEASELDITDEFKPLVAYKMFFDLASKDMEQGWKCFESASVATVEYLCAGLMMNGEAEVADNIRRMKQVKPLQIKYIRDYLVSNVSYLQTKMVMYVRENIEKFQ